MYNSTIKPKQGQCLDCPQGTLKYLIAGRCDPHYKIFRAKVCEERKESRNPAEVKTTRKRTRIRRRSVKGEKEDRKYTIGRLKFLAQPGNQRCFVDGCNSRADTVEHTRGRRGYADEWARENKISLLLDVRFWKPCCNFHNLEFERNSDLSEKYQLSKISGKKKIIKK